MIPTNGVTIMKELISYLNCFNMNASQYWLIPDTYQCSDYEITWIRTANGNPVWKIRVKGNEQVEWEEFNNSNIINALSQKGVDLVELRKQINETILKQAVYAMQIANNAKMLLGENTVDTAVVEAEELVEELVEKIKNTFKHKKNAKGTKSNLKLMR